MQYFPKANFHSGGTIYQWELGWHVSACQVAKKFGHPEVLNLLLERCPADEKLLNACWLHDEALVKSLLAAHPDLAPTLPSEGRRQLAHAARNNDSMAARLMLAAGLPVESFGQHHATPLHWAAWHGNAELVRLILTYNPPIENSDNDYKVTPLNWAIHGSAERMVSGSRGLPRDGRSVARCGCAPSREARRHRRGARGLAPAWIEVTLM